MYCVRIPLWCPLTTQMFLLHLSSGRLTPSPHQDQAGHGRVQVPPHARAAHPLRALHKVNTVNITITVNIAIIVNIILL